MIVALGSADGNVFRLSDGVLGGQDGTHLDIAQELRIKRESYFYTCTTEGQDTSFPEGSSGISEIDELMRLPGDPAGRSPGYAPLQVRRQPSYAWPLPFLTIRWQLPKEER